MYLLRVDEEGYRLIFRPKLSYTTSAQLLLYEHVRAFICSLARALNISRTNKRMMMSYLYNMSGPTLNSEGGHGEGEGQGCSL